MLNKKIVTMKKRILFVNLTVIDNKKPKHFNKVVITEGVSHYKRLPIDKIEIIKQVGFTNNKN
jgi:hypothetical protein